MSWLDFVDETVVFHQRWVRLVIEQNISLIIISTNCTMELVIRNFKSFVLLWSGIRFLENTNLHTECNWGTGEDVFDLPDSVSPGLLVDYSGGGTGFVSKPRRRWPWHANFTRLVTKLFKANAYMAKSRGFFRLHSAANIFVLHNTARNQFLQQERRMSGAQQDSYLMTKSWTQMSSVYQY